MIIDAYTLVGGYPLRPQRMGLSELTNSMSKACVDLAAVMSLRAIHADPHKGNEWLLSAAARDHRIIPIGVVSPRTSHLDAASHVSYCVENGAAALAFFMTSLGVGLGSLSFRRILTEAANSQLPIVVCGLQSAGGPTQVAELTQGLGCPG